MKLPVPNTQVITLAKDDLPEDRRKALVQDKMIADTPTYVGSVQQFETADGAFSSQCSLADRGRLDPQSVQEMAVFDLITLNTDRHGKNFLVRKTPGGSDKLVPIDHGNCFPDKAALGNRNTKIGNEFNALMGVPAAHQPFLPAIQTMISDIDPDGLETMLKQERDALTQKHGPIGAALSPMMRLRYPKSRPGSSSSLRQPCVPRLSRSH